MGYDLHITRKEFWSDPDGDFISLSEWKSYVIGDKDIESDLLNPGPENYVIRFSPEPCPLWWTPSGEICTKNPSPEVISKLVEIAAALQARVLGMMMKYMELILKIQLYLNNAKNPCGKRRYNGSFHA